MLALTVEPGVAGSAALSDLPDPLPAAGDLLIKSIAVGICGTDREIVAGTYGQAPPGRERLVLGHEALGSVVDPRGRPGFSAGDLVVPFVRRPDPLPCVACAAGEWDMCRNGLYTEHGIKALDGFIVEEYAVPADAVVKVGDRLGGLTGVLVEPASVVAKAWRQITAIGSRAAWQPQRVLVTGAGPIGLLAALFGVQRGFDVHVVDVVYEGPKPYLVRGLGATYHTGSVESVGAEADIVIECSGIPQVVVDLLSATRPAGIVCLTGVSASGRYVRIDAGAVNRELVLENDVVFGTVNANAQDYRDAVDVLGSSSQTWLAGLLSRFEPLERWQHALARQSHDVKVVIKLDDG